jgi:hypothetical protein
MGNCFFIIEVEAVSNSISANVFGLCVRTGFGALHYQPSTNVDRSTALDITTSAPIVANGC